MNRRMLNVIWYSKLIGEFNGGFEGYADNVYQRSAALHNKYPSNMVRVFTIVTGYLILIA